jgi:hypothetical protein
MFPFERWLAGSLPVDGRIDLNLTAFDEDITRNRAIFPAFFRRSV